MEILISYGFLKAQTNESIIKFLNDTFPGYNIYSISTAWRESREYILKAKGTNGDIIATWK